MTVVKKTHSHILIVDEEGIVATCRAYEVDDGRAHFEWEWRDGCDNDITNALILCSIADQYDPSLRVKLIAAAEVLVAKYELKQAPDWPF